MSPMRPLTSSGSTDTIVSNAISHPRAERVGRHQVDVAAEDSRQEVADVEEGEGADGTIELDERIDVAGRRRLVAPGGAEQLKGRYADRPQTASA
jgi:hypothetical protein